jgi:hypothetical protein
MEEESFSFQGTYETKARIRGDWLNPRYLRMIEFDSNCPIEEFSLDEPRVVTAAWFLGPSDGGAMVRLESVGRLGPRDNDPAISIRTYLPQDRKRDLYHRLIERLTPLIAVNSPTLWGLATISNLSKDFHVDPFVHGTTYVAAEIALLPSSPPSNLDLVSKSSSPPAGVSS